MENSPELKALIRKNAHLFWYIKDSEKENLPLPVVLEFFEQIEKSERAANNYEAVSRNYFTLYFKKYAS